MSSTVSLLTLGLLAMSSTTVALGPAAVQLGTAANYAILAQSGVSTVPSSAITGDIGLSPAANTFLTGFALTLALTGTFSTSSQVAGRLFSASYASPTPATLTAAIGSVHAARTDASGRLNPDFTNFNAGELGGQTLTPGLYKWTTGVTVGGNVTIVGTALDTWIFQIPSTFSISSGARVVLVGALARNVVWVVGGAATLGPSAHLEGVLLGSSAITVQTGGSVNGRLLAQTLVSLQKATVVAPV